MTAPRLYAGIDPGLGGAIGFVREDGTPAGIFDMPCLMQTTGRRAIDPAGLAAILREHSPAFVLVERVGARPGEGATGAFSFGMSYGTILAVCATLALPHDVIQPAVWKRRAGMPPGADKGVSITLAKRLFPTADTYLARKKDDGRAEALLLAMQAWERRT